MNKIKLILLEDQKNEQMRHHVGYFLSLQTIIKKQQ
jgi:hypothetical protein